MTLSVNARQQQVENLTKLNTQSFIEAFQLERTPFLQPTLRAALRFSARRIAQTALQYDDNVSNFGVFEGSKWLLDTIGVEVETRGTHRIPQSGPLLITSNHPGMNDIIALLATLGRCDVQIVARQNPFLIVLDGMQKHIIMVADGEQKRIGAVRSVVRHLRAGGVVILFPAGKIEPDPALRDNADHTLTDWSDSVELFTRRVPDVRVLPAAIGGVISPQALRNPLTRLYRTEKRKDWVAATLMMLMEHYRHVTVSVRYGEPVIGSPAMPAVRKQMTDLLAGIRADTPTSI